MMFNVHFEIKRVEELKQKLEQKYNQSVKKFELELTKRMLQMLMEIRRAWPKKTGKTAAGITLIMGPNSFKLVADSKVVWYIEYGTKDHGPVTAKFLRFEIDGQVIYTKWVEGILAQGIIGEAVQRLEADLESWYQG